MSFVLLLTGPEIHSYLQWLHLFAILDYKVASVILDYKVVIYIYSFKFKYSCIIIIYTLERTYSDHTLS